MRAVDRTISDWLEMTIPEPNSGCLLWLGPVFSNGYGNIQMRIKGKRESHLAHRYFWEHLIGEIPEAMTLDHKCRVRCCVNLDHLRIMSQKDNALCAGDTSLVVRNKQKTQCDNGHEFNHDNTYINPYGHRVCRECRRRHKAEHLKRKGYRQ